MKRVEELATVVLAPWKGPGPWVAVNNGSGKRIWFLCRDNAATRTGTDYHLNARGDLIRYASRRTAERAASRLTGGAS